jgi:hypothetical protein
MKSDNGVGYIGLFGGFLVTHKQIVDLAASPPPRGMT